MVYYSFNLKKIEVNMTYCYPRDVTIKKEDTCIGVLFNFFMTIVWAIVELTPYLSRNTNGYFRLAVFCVWLFSLLFLTNVNSLLNNRLFIVPVLIVVYQFLLAFVGLSNVTLLVLIDRLRIYFIPLGMSLIMKRYSKSKCKSLFTWLLVIVSLNIIHNIYLFSAGIVSNDVSVGDVTLGASARLTNAGDTSFCFLVSFVILLSEFLLFGKQKKVKFFGTVLFLLGVWFLFFLNSRAISIILLLLGTYFFICYVFIKNRSSMSRFLRWLIIVFLSLFLLLNISSVLALLGNIQGNNWMEEKMKDLINFISGGEIGSYGSLSSRFELYSFSINSYFKNPITFIFGIGEQSYKTASVDILRSLGISGHSDIFDEAAQYGTIGLVLMFLLYYHSFKEMKKYANNNLQKAMINIVMLVFFLYGFLNHFTYGNVFFVIFLMFPLFIKSISLKWRNN